MAKRSARVEGSPALPPPPRRIRASAAGWALIACSAALVATGIGGAVILSQHAAAAPQVFPVWPGFAVPAACLCAIVGLIAALRRQVRLLEYGRPAVATITQVDKKRSENGAYWRVEYEWTLLDGAKRRGRYTHRSKTPPAVGTPLSIIYDRDQPQRHSRYPLALVRVAT